MSNPSNSLANNTPHTPQGLRARNSFRLRSRNCMLAIPPHPCPSHYGGRVVVTVCRWDRCNWLAMEPKRGPPGPLSAQNVTGVPSMKLRSVLGHTVRPDRAKPSRLLPLRKGHFDAVGHLGLYTAKPFPQRIESHQGHSRDNASDANLFDRFTDTRRHVRSPD
jgi:hypothetical protein